MSIALQILKDKKSSSNETDTQANGSKSNGPSPARTLFSPRFDIWESEDELILYGELPGVEASDLDLHFEKQVLTIHGKVSRQHNALQCIFSEYAIGDFQREFTIGESINSNAITAELKNGVLEVRLPKAEKAKPRRIEIATR